MGHRSAGIPARLRPADGRGAMINMMSEPRWNPRGYVPHIDPLGAIQMVTFRTRDSLPGHVATAIDEHVRAMPPSERRDELERRTDAYLASGHGACLLGIPAVAHIVARTLRHYDGIRYHLRAWCVMPNHVHVVVTRADGSTLPTIVHGWKGYSATEVNRLIGRSGALWMPDYFDRIIRDDDHLWRAVEYVHANPVRAGLCGRPEDWEWSSARNHALSGPPAP